MLETNERRMQAVEREDVAKSEQTRPGPVYTPAVDILEDATGFTVLADLPGVRTEGLSVDLREGMLTIRGRCEQLGGENEHEVLCEFEPGTYFRQFALPEAIEQGKIEAKLTNGVLRIHLPKAEAARPRRIQVASS